MANVNFSAFSSFSINGNQLTFCEGSEESFGEIEFYTGSPKKVTLLDSQLQLVNPLMQKYQGKETSLKTKNNIETLVRKILNIKDLSNPVFSKLKPFIDDFINAKGPNAKDQIKEKIIKFLTYTSNGWTEPLSLKAAKTTQKEEKNDASDLSFDVAEFLASIQDCFSAEPEND